MPGHLITRRCGEQIAPAKFQRVIRDLEKWLRVGGYAEPTIAFYRQAAVHFACWVFQRHVQHVRELTHAHVSRFLSHHLRRCRCRVGGVRQYETVRAGLRRLETVLDAGGYRRARSAPLTAVDQEVRRFDAHLRTTCGLQEATREYRRRYLRDFLLARFANDHLDLSGLIPTDVVHYISMRASRLAPGSAKVLASSLRSYFRFLRLRGLCDDALAMAVPAPANWRLASLPKALTDAQVARLLATFDHGTVTGRRDYAITRCVLDLGLRANDVVGLHLEDLDWRRGTMRLGGGKSRRSDTLPLTAPIGYAITAYLRRGRPTTTSRQVFLCVRPRGRAVTSRTVRDVIRSAGQRAGLGSLVTGTRILRHTAATRLLRHGASLKEIADILRHRSIDTTAIYTKVDVARLKSVAAPWPTLVQS